MCWDGGASQQFKQIISVEEAEYIIRGFVAKTDTAVGINVVHHQGDVSLSILSQICTLWNEVANELVISFGGTFLVGSPGIAEKDSGSVNTGRGKLKAGGIRELTAVVGKAKPEDTGEALMSQRLIQEVKHLFHRSGVSASAKDGYKTE